jgi:gliding motility-associated-like protein
MKRQVITILFILCARDMFGQTCTNTGQTPSSAIFICNSDTHTQPTIPACGNLVIPLPCDGGSNYSNKNPVWFRFACFSNGTLGFVITPDDLSEDFNWVLFDKTNHNPEDVFTDESMFVACNWSSDAGKTGTSEDGVLLTVCSGSGQLTFSTMPWILQGREYLLMVSHNSESQNGFQLEFTGGSAVIVDPVGPHIKSARTSCDRRQVILKMNTLIYCNTLAPDGSDFIISPLQNISGAWAPNCNSGPFTDSVIIILDNPLPLGNYTIAIKTGSDGNTIKDHCGRFIPAGNNALFTAGSAQFTAMDSLLNPTCQPKELKLYFRRPILCSSIATNGSDFMITGPQAVSISGISADCNNSSYTQTITLHLSSPITSGGAYAIKLKTGTDGNTLIDECWNHTPPSDLNFTLADGVSASFDYTVKPGCKLDTVFFSHNGAFGVNNWLWNFDNTTVSNLQNPVKIFPASGQYQVQLSVSNGSCSDTAALKLVLNDAVKVAFDIPQSVCPEDGLVPVNNSTGAIANWLWRFGDGHTSIIKEPAVHFFPVTGKETYYTVWLTATGLSGCRDSISRRVQVLGSCIIDVPTAFSPNNDGLNDYLYPLNALKADNLDFRVFNRSGNLVFASNNWQKKWDGNINGIPQPSGIYAWILRYTQADTGKKIQRKGTTLLIR